jgi:hypothetical protein
MRHISLGILIQLNMALCLTVIHLSSLKQSYMFYNIYSIVLVSLLFNFNTEVGIYLSIFLQKQIVEKQQPIKRVLLYSFFVVKSFYFHLRVSLVFVSCTTPFFQTRLGLNLFLFFSENTTSCSHYRSYGASADARAKCATNGCQGCGNRACHVIASNQNAANGHRILVYMCSSCNATYDKVLELRSNAQHVDLTSEKGCKCGHE